MSFELTPFTPAPVVPGADQLGMVSSASTAQTQFTTEGTQWKDLPAQVGQIDPGTGSMVTSSIDDLGELFVHANGSTCQVQVAWRAYLDRIVVIWVHRQVDSRRTPLGPWYVHSHSIFRPTAPITRTTGSLPPAPPAAPGRSQGSAPATPAAFRNGQRAASYLPSAVQHGMITQVPRPGLWTGEIYQVSRDNEPVEQEVGVLRMDENAAVVVHAMRTRPRSGVGHAHAAQHLAQTPWTITQVTYDLRQRQTLEGGTRTAIGGAR